MDHNEMLERAVLGLFITPSGTNRPSVFLTSLYCSLKQFWREDIPTACVNSKMELWINPEWFASISPAMRETLLAHELWHLAFMHVDPARLGNRCPDVWNAACDHAINLMLLEHGFTFDKFPPGHPEAGKPIGLLDPRFKGMSAEEIYDILIKEGLPMTLPFGKDFDATPGQAISPAAAAGITSAVVRAVTMSKMSGREAGSLPGSLVTLIDNLLNPRLPWDALLRRWLTELSQYGASWRRPSRRFEDIYMPGRTGQEGLAHLRWYLDCSGSVTDSQLHAYASEIAGAKATHNPEQMTVTSFDTKLRDTWEFSSDQEITGLEFHGRGGTNLTEVFADIRKHRPSAAVIISDLFVDIPTQSPGVPILWICVDNPEARVPFGTLIHLDTSTTTKA